MTSRGNTGGDRFITSGEILSLFILATLLLPCTTAAFAPTEPPHLEKRCRLALQHDRGERNPTCEHGPRHATLKEDQHGRLTKLHLDARE